MPDRIIHANCSFGGCYCASIGGIKAIQKSLCPCLISRRYSRCFSFRLSQSNGCCIISINISGDRCHISGNEICISTTQPESISSVVETRRYSFTILFRDSHHSQFTGDINTFCCEHGILCYNFCSFIYTYRSIIQKGCTIKCNYSLITYGYLAVMCSDATCKFSFSYG
ncbi:Uncharacterised protein [Escherichia coli]|nr:Uncharacterised protein [Escherichia coli]CTY46538.1 Uncharacterised protein [Escherichia coli]CTZ36694.1 Uncharacterised protein [Escherichia coli]CUA54729.1 Uncharacterised protein [Escherichia coli]